jgi:SAM-dependent methyltransferase
VSNVHPTAARGFDSTADLYERARPGYPADAIDFVVESMSLLDAKLVVDLGAGTGKFTRELVARGIPTVGVEPVAGMRATFEQQLPGVEVLDASAESLPFGDASVSAVVAAQAFHWFATDAAVAEIARVLRPGGSFGLVWNARDDSVDWVARVTDIFKKYEGADGVRVPRHRERAWRAPLERSRAFSLGVEREFPNSQSLTPDGLVERLASVSFIAVLPDDEKARAIGELRDLLDSHADLRGRTEIDHPYVTEVYVFRRA